MPSKSTTPVTIRLSNDVLEVIDRRVKKYPGAMTRSFYIALRLEYDIRRKHNPKKKKR